MKFSVFFYRINLKQLLLATLLSLGLSLFVYLIFFQSPLLSKREYAFTMLLWVALTPLLYLLLSRFLLPRLHEYTPRAQRNWLLISAATGFFFIFVSRPPIFILIAELSQNIPIAASVSRLLTGFTVGFLFLVITLFLAGVQLKAAQPIKHKKGYWLLYAIPMIAVWGIYLLTFWPGMMSNDSGYQWNQLVTGQFINSHSVFHTLTMWLITRLWFSPAAVVIFQILALSLTVAWGISLLEAEAIPPWAAWGLSALIALSPVNGDMVIILWADILYSTSLLLFSLMILKIVFTHGEWLSRKTTWIWLGLVCLCVASIRHNGVPIPILSIPILILVYKKWWKPLLASLALFLAMWFLIQGPGYDLLKVNRYTGATIRLFSHHIAAHIMIGGPLSPEQQKIANEIFDISKLKYDCCNQLPSTLALRSFKDSPDIPEKIQQLSVELAVKETWVEIQHQACASSMVWEVPSRCSVLSFLPYSSYGWISSKYINIDENSQLPYLLPLLSSFLLRYIRNSSLLLSPSLYFYLGLFTVSFMAFRKLNPKLLFFSLPMVIQSTLFMVISLGSDFRFQFAIMLIALFSFGLLYLALCSPREIQPGLKNNSEK